MADGTYQYQQRAGQHYYFPQPGSINHHPREIPRSSSPGSSHRPGFSADTPSPSRSPTPQSPARLYGLYNSSTHQQQGHNTMMNGNQAGQRFPVPMNMGPKYPQQQHHGHGPHNIQHQQQQQHQHQDHVAHNANHQHTFSSGGLSNATPHYPSSHLQNGTVSNGQSSVGKPQTEYWSQQLQLAAESRQANSPNYFARTQSTMNKVLVNASPGNARGQNDDERYRPSAEPIKRKQQDWMRLDVSGHGLRSLSTAIFNYQFLTTLHLSHNRLSSLPQGIGRMRSLTHLDLSANQLTELPAELGMLVKLKNLYLFDNNLRTLPSELGSLYRLDVLGIDGNPLNEELRNELMQNGTNALISYLREQAPVNLPPSQRDWIQLDSGSDEDVEKFSALNYNILCDKYATRSQYGYTPSQALSWDYRKDLILNDIRDQNADVVCLQEIDQQSFNDYFRPNLAYNDYKGIFHSKSRAKTMNENEAKLVDGCAIFYKNAKYIMLDKQVIDFSNIAINRPDMKGEADIFNRVMNKDNISVVAFFENRMTGSRVIVANAHIYWDPIYKDVKVVQAAILLEQVTKFAEKYARWPACTDKAAFRHSEPTVDGEETPAKPTPEPRPSLEYASGSDIPLLLCGDFNSKTDSGVYELIAQGEIAGDHSEFSGRSYGTFTREGVTHPFNLKSAYSNIGELSFTNYTPDFTDVVDYIWYSSNSLEATGLLGEIDHEYLTRVPGFPHYHFPSDHLPLLAEFAVKPQISPSKASGSRPDFGPRRESRQ